MQSISVSNGTGRDGHDAFADGAPTCLAMHNTRKAPDKLVDFGEVRGFRLLALLPAAWRVDLSQHTY
jgi:hypothetical protein